MTNTKHDESQDQVHNLLIGEWPYAVVQDGQLVVVNNRECTCGEFKLTTYWT